MSTENKAYEQQVYALSDRMRQKLIDTGDAQRLSDDAFIPILARLAVAEMAEEICGLLQYVTAWADCEIQDELIKRGLIPDNAQEGNPHE